MDNESPTTGIAIELYLGKIKNIQLVNQKALKLFSHKIISEDKFYDANAYAIFNEVKKIFRSYINQPKNWNNITYNLHDGYCCFLVVGYDNNSIKKKSDWYWSPKSKSSSPIKAWGYTPYKVGDKYLKFRYGSGRTNLSKYYGKFNRKGTWYHLEKSDNMKVQSYTTKDKKTNEIKQRLAGLLYHRPNLFYQRGNNLLPQTGTYVARKMFNMYQVSHNVGITIVLANATYYSYYLEKGGRDVISSLVGAANQMVKQFGDSSQDTSVVIRKVEPKYTSVNKKELGKLSINKIHIEKKK